MDSITIRNNIITNNLAYGIKNYTHYGDPFDISYNDVWGNASGPFDGDVFPITGNISADPEFSLENQFDYTLRAASPCIDAGDPEVPVPEGGGDRLDIGAFEYSIPFNDVALLFEDLPDTIVKGDTLHIVLSMTNPFQSPVMMDVWFTASGWRGSATLEEFRDVTIPADTTLTGTLSFPVPLSIEMGRYNIHAKIGYIDEWIADAESAIIQVVD